MRKFKKALALAKTEQSQGKKGAEIMMGESKSDDSSSKSEKTKMLASKLEFKAKEGSFKKKMKNDIGTVQTETNKFDLEAEQDKKKFIQLEKLHEMANVKKSSVSDAEYKARQMKWLKMVKTTSKKNCK